MHSAPAVTYPVGRSYFEARLSWSVLGLAAALLSLGWLGLDHAGWRQILLIGTWLVCAAMVLRSARRSSTGVLRWDGQNWHWESNDKAQAGMVLPRLDWQAGVLLEFRTTEHRVLWLWLERCAEPLHWDALRRALWAGGSGSARQPARAAGDA